MVVLLSRLRKLYDNNLPVPTSTPKLSWTLLGLIRLEMWVFSSLIRTVTIWIWIWVIGFPIWPLIYSFRLILGWFLFSIYWCWALACWIAIWFELGHYISWIWAGIFIKSCIRSFFLLLLRTGKEVWCWLGGGGRLLRLFVIFFAFPMIFVRGLRVFFL